ncbi:MAG: HPr(Ser) kinase/phosphatase [Fluviibacter phosphoraccumulans]|jgi:HPr kinase/phosphorylase
MKELSVAQLFEAYKDRLALSWVGSIGCNRSIRLVETDAYGSDIVGHLNIIHPDRLQVVGSAEQKWALRTRAQRRQSVFEDLCQAAPPAIIVADNLPVLDELREACEKTGTPLFSSTLSCSVVIDQLRHYLARKLGTNTNLHGVFMDVLGMGVMITGDSGSGKSELALELISRGHGLVADDVVELTRVAPNVIFGSCPSLLRDFLEVRGLGLLNIRTIFGETASRRKMRLKLIVHLHRQQPNVDTPRLPFEAQTQEILGVSVRKVNIPVAAGRNLAVLLEAAVRNTILQFRGIDSLEEFISRQQQEVLVQEDVAAKSAQRALALDPAHTIRAADIDDPSI